jgi:hypothetical protein
VNLFSSSKLVSSLYSATMLAELLLNRCSEIVVARLSLESTSPWYWIHPCLPYLYHGHCIYLVVGDQKIF